MSDCIRCDIHDLLEPELASEEANFGQIAAKVTEVLADLVLIKSTSGAGQRLRVWQISSA